MEIVQYHIFVSGKVQGVGFRFRTRLKALKLEITGWVKNLPDGRVEIVAQGEKNNLNELLNWIKSTLFFSKVEKINFFQEELKDRYNNFLIKYDHF